MSKTKHIGQSTLLEKFLLLFVKRKANRTDGILEIVTVYKMLFGSVYIITHGPLPPRHYNCRCAIGDYDE